MLQYVSKGEHDDRRYGFFKHAFDAYWIDSLVRTLLKAKEEIK